MLTQFFVLTDEAHIHSVQDKIGGAPSKAQLLIMARSLIMLHLLV
jgi:hypothetical protein